MLDFGLSSQYGDAKLVTTYGSPIYSAPEVVEGKSYNGPEIDIWSLGVNLYAMVVGEFPFNNQDPAELRQDITKGKYTFPENVAISPDCREMISKLLCVNPEKRLTIKDIKEHQWFAEGLNTVGLDAAVLPGTLAVPKTLEELDTRVLDELELTGVKRERIVSSILNLTFDEWYGSYHTILLAEKKDAEINESEETGTEQASSPVTENVPTEKVQPRTMMDDYSETDQARIREKLEARQKDASAASGKPVKRATSIKSTRKPSKPEVEDDISNYNGDNLTKILMGIEVESSATGGENQGKPAQRPKTSRGRSSLTAKSTSAPPAATSPSQRPLTAKSASNPPAAANSSTSPGQRPLASKSTLAPPAAANRPTSPGQRSLTAKAPSAPPAVEKGLPVSAQKSSGPGKKLPPVKGKTSVAK